MPAINLKESKEWSYLGIALLVAFLLILPIAILGIPRGNDLPQHFQFAQTYYNSLMTGDGFPNWSSQENLGYGSIGIRFYPPVSYYVLAFARMISGSWYDAAWLAFAFWMVLGSAGIYFWSRCWFSPKISALAAIFYAIFPYHLNQIYISFFYADFAGAAIMTFCFAFQTRVFRRGTKADVLGLSIFYTLLILTHLPSAIVGSISMMIYGLILLEKRKAVRQITQSAIAGFLGLAASSYYWLTMVSEMGWLNHATEKYQSGHYYFGNRFFPMIFNSFAGDSLDNLLLSDIITAISLLFFITAFVYLLYKKSGKAEKDSASQIYRLILPLGLFALFMTTALSYPVWKILTPMQKIQFPMRWMAVVSMCGSMIAAAAFYYLHKGEFLKNRIWIYTCTIFLSIFLFIDFTYMLFPSAFMPTDRAQFEADMRDLPGQINQKFWWSIWSKEDALKITEKVSAENRAAAIDVWNPEQRSFTVAKGEATNARIATFYYPRWQAEVNGSPVEIAQDENGAILIPIPAGKSSVKLYFQETPGSIAASMFSLIVWISFALSGLFLAGKSLFSLNRPLKKFPEPHTAN